MTGVSLIAGLTRNLLPLIAGSFLIPGLTRDFYIKNVSPPQKKYSRQ